MPYYQPSDFVRIRRRKRSVMIQVEKVESVPGAIRDYLRVSGVRVRQSDFAKLSGNYELRRGYYYVPAEDVSIVKQTCAWCGGEVTDENRVVHAGRFNARLYVFNHPSCLAAFVRDTTADNS